MTTDTMNSILTDLNHRLVKHKRKIVLSFDNAPSHDPALKEKFSNMKVVFLPTNITSRLQPLDAGTIKNLKGHYRRVLLQHILEKIESNDLTASSIVKTVDVLIEIRQIKHAWEEVKPQTIAKCFSHCGEIPQEQGTEDQFAGLDDDDQDNATARLQKLVNQLGSGIVTAEYKAADHDLHVHVCACVSFDDSVKWRGELRDTVCNDMESFAKIPAAMQDDDSDR